ncbi:MAG: hypothetical protein QT03_C0001G0472 [archaeon GW2011_AR10]|nr:MAG: hypothetical protein QT03_C0001G0472 [archaeon GW2011_AR10]
MPTNNKLREKGSKILFVGEIIQHMPKHDSL